MGAPFDADCGRCASLAASRLPDGDVRRFAFRMYLCPECGNKRCRKAGDHEFACDKGASTEALDRVQRTFREAMDRRAATKALTDLIAAADKSPAVTWTGRGGVKEIALAHVAALDETGGVA